MTVDVSTGYRRYATSQAGRVHAIAALQALGFGLGEIRDLLGADLTAARLTEHLRARESALSTEVEEATGRQAEVRRRLRSIEKGYAMTEKTMELGPLPRWNGVGLTEAVLDESEIGGVARRLAERVRAAMPPGGELLYLYDGSRHDRIEVSVGVEHRSTAADDDLRPLSVGAVQDAVSVRFEETADNVGDAWVALDAGLEPYGLKTIGVHRYQVLAAGGVILSAPVVPADKTCSS